MKLTNLCILFVVLELAFIAVLDSRMNHINMVSGKTTEFNKALDSSVDDGALDLVEVDNNRNIFLNKEKAVEQFFLSLYSNFGVADDVIKQRKLREHVPIILITDEDGFYIYHMDTHKVLNDVVLEGRWSEKYPYIYEDDNYIYKFTFKDRVTLYDRSTSEFITGNYKELALLYSDSIMTDESTFDTYRRNAIIHELEKWMNYYINKYNNIAYQFGITYQFWLPTIDKADWYRTIDDVSMFVIFQNYPYNAGSLDTYNRYAFGGARITKSKQYYIMKIDGIDYYHRDSCSYLNSNPQGTSYYTKEECAKRGAFPCSTCNP